MPTRRIVLGVDGSDGSVAALAWCAEFAPLLDAEAVAVYALPIITSMEPPGMMSLTASTFDDETRTGLLETVEEWCAPLRDAGVAYRPELRDGGASRAILEVADEVEASLIVVGRRGHGGFTGLLLGSVASQLSHHAELPLVIVPPHGSASDD